MKKIFKIFCWSVALLLEIILIISVLCFIFKYIIVLPDRSSLIWEKKGSDKFLSIPANRQVKDFLIKQEFKMKYGRDSNIYCAVATSSFNRRYFIKKRNVELKTFLLCLADIAVYAKGNTAEDENEGLLITAKLKWGDFDISVNKKVAWQGNAKQIEVIRTENISVSKKGIPYITYVRNNKEEKFSKNFARVSNSSAYDSFIRNFLKYQPEAIKFEYSAWSWNKEKKEGEFALCLLVDTSNL